MTISHYFLCTCGLPLMKLLSTLHKLHNGSNPLLFQYGKVHTVHNGKCFCLGCCRGIYKWNNNTWTIVHYIHHSFGQWAELYDTTNKPFLQSHIYQFYGLQSHHGRFYKKQIFRNKLLASYTFSGNACSQEFLFLYYDNTLQVAIHLFHLISIHLSELVE